MDATGAVVGRAGEVFVDANGNAINAEGQVVGSATASVPDIIASVDQAVPQEVAVERATPVTDYAANYSDELDDGTQFEGRTYAPEATVGLAEPVTDGAWADDFTRRGEAGLISGAGRDAGLVEDAGLTPDLPTYGLGAGAAVAGAATAGLAYDAAPKEPAEPMYRNAAALAAEGDPGYRSGVVGGDGYGDAGYDPRNKYADGPDGVAQNVYGDGVYGDGTTFASRAFGQNRDTDMLDRDAPEQPLTEFGRNDMAVAAEQLVEGTSYGTVGLGPDVVEEAEGEAVYYEDPDSAFNA
jgi:hypothetical protein